MKLKKVKILVEPLHKTNERWIKALKGKAKMRFKGELITVSSWEVLGKVLSPPRLQILALIPILKPKSILDLAKSLKKNFKNVYSDVQFLAGLGLLELHTEGDKRVIPIAKYDGIELSLAA